MTRRLRYLIGSCGVLVALVFTASTASAQGDSWDRLVAEADSIGPQTPRMAPSRWIACGPGVETPDSVQVSSSGGSDEFLFAQRSLRTRGYFSYLEPPSTGSGRFALRNILCDPQGERPRTFVPGAGSSLLLPGLLAPGGSRLPGADLSFRVRRVAAVPVGSRPAYVHRDPGFLTLRAADVCRVRRPSCCTACWRRADRRPAVPEDLRDSFHHSESSRHRSTGAIRLQEHAP